MTNQVAPSGASLGDFLTFSPLMELIGHGKQVQQGFSEANSILKTGLSLKLGDYTLIAVGIILGLGALLISQRETVVKIAQTTGKGTALAAV